MEHQTGKIQADHARKIVSVKAEHEEDTQSELSNYIREADRKRENKFFDDRFEYDLRQQNCHRKRTFARLSAFTLFILGSRSTDEIVDEAKAMVEKPADIALHGSDLSVDRLCENGHIRSKKRYKRDKDDSGGISDTGWDELSARGWFSGGV